MISNAPADPGHVIHNFGCKIDEINEAGEAQVSLAGRPFTIRREFIEDISAARLTPAIAGLKRALLVLHAPRDQTVGIENAGEIFSAAKHPKSFVTLDNADHLLSRAEDAEYAADVIAAWSRRYLGLKDDPAPADAPEGIARVSEVDPAGFLQDIEAGPKHHLLADEPASYGGTDAGPSPYQFLSAGLGACTSMTIRMYAKRKGWPLEHVSVDVSHDKVHAQDCADCPDKTAKALARRVRRVHHRTGRKVTLVGHSLGGLLVKSVSQEHPEMVESVVTMGSPFKEIVRAHPAVIGLWDRLKLVQGGLIGRNLNPSCGTGHCTCAFVRNMMQPRDTAPPQFAIYSKGDGVVEWTSCIEDEEHRNAEVKGTHIGMVYNADVFRALSNRLADVT